VGEQHGQQQAGLRGQAQRDRPVAVGHAQRSQNAEKHPTRFLDTVLFRGTVAYAVHECAAEHGRTPPVWLPDSPSSIWKRCAPAPTEHQLDGTVVGQPADLNITVRAGPPP
jgi:hypothetical protein